MSAQDKKTKPVCWNCRKAIKVDTEYGELFVPCKDFLLGLECKWIESYTNEKDFHHKVIRCPVATFNGGCDDCLRMPRCTFDDAVCPDCPVDWTQLRV